VLESTGTKRRASRKKTLTLAKGFFLTRASCIAPPRKPSRNRCATAMSDGASRSAISAPCGCPDRRGLRQADLSYSRS